METSGRCKLYPEQHRVWDNGLARPSPRGGWNPGAIPGLDRWLSEQAETAEAVEKAAEKVEETAENIKETIEEEKES